MLQVVAFQLEKKNSWDSAKLSVEEKMEMQNYLQKKKWKEMGRNGVYQMHNTQDEKKIMDTN